MGDWGGGGGYLLEIYKEMWVTGGGGGIHWRST